jgi:hypothetical protein
MNQTRFNAVTQSVTRVPSRRDVLRGLAGAGIGTLWLPGIADAKNKRGKKRKKKNTQQPTSNCTPNCVDRTCGSDGCGGSCGTCAADQVCHGGTCCVPESQSTTCAGRCGTWTNNCRQPVACPTCPTGQQCLSNGSCAQVCGSGVPCPSYCTGCSVPSTEGETHCVAGNNPTVCPTQACSSTADCPAGKQCQMCQGSGRCTSLCS